MKFEMWSVFHFVYIFGTIAATVVLYFLLRNKLYKTRYIVGEVIGVLSLISLIVRNVDIFKRRNGSRSYSATSVPFRQHNGICQFGFPQ